MNKDREIFAPSSEIEHFLRNTDVDDTLFSTQTKRGDSITSHQKKPSHIRSTVLIGIGFIICIGQLYILQIAQGQSFRALANGNRVRDTIIPATRGIIKDRQGVLLAYNTPAFQLYLNDRFYRLGDRTPVSEERQREVLSALAQMTGIPISLNDTLSGSTIESYTISTNIDYDTATKLLAWKDMYPEYSVESYNQRTYITDRVPSLSHILGYIGKMSEEQYAEYRNRSYRLIDTVGQSGIEKQYEELLRGSPGKEQTEVNALNQVQRIASIASPQAGQDITLTIDVSLQSHIESVLRDRLISVGHTRASVIVMDPYTGAILAMVSWPAYDANLFTTGDRTQYNDLLANEDRPLFNRAISGAYPSGSTIKPLYSAAALIEGIITPTTTFLSSGGLQVGPWFFPDWKAGGHGTTNVYKAIAESVNTFFYIIVGGYDTFEGLGIERLTSYARLFGLASPTGIDEPGEVAGFLPSPAWKLEKKGERWYVGDTYNVSIGQGDVLVTPLQMTRVAATFANGGLLVQPHLLASQDTNATRIIPEDIAHVIQVGMRETVLTGTSKTLQPLPVTSAGKTGTAQWSNGKANHSWFIGYAPYENPEVVITVLVEEDKTGFAAVPIVYDVLRFWFDENNDRGTI